MPKALDKGKFFEKIGYFPYYKQRLFHASRARFKVMVAGRRAGKSTMSGKDAEPELFVNERRRYWIVGPNYDLGEKEFRVMWNDLIIELKLGQDKRVKKAYSKKQGDMYMEFPWGTRIEVRSAQHPESLVGDGLHGVIMSEAAKHSEDTWERYIRPALADYRGWATFPTTPEGMNWLHKLWQYGQNPTGEYEDYESWQFPSWENRVLYPEGRNDPEIKLIELTTSPEWFAQEIGADFTAFSGRIYSEFQEVSHVKPVTYNPEWTNVMCFDWGFVNPLACIEFQIDPWDNIYIWREHYESYKTLQQHLQIIRNREQPEGYKIDMCFGDAADPEAAQEVTNSYVYCAVDPDAKKNWREGIELVKTFLKEYETGLVADEYGTPLTQPKLFVDNSCVHTIKEFNNYKATEGPRTSRNKTSPREDAQKYDDHALDAVRYAMMHIYKLGAQHHLKDVAEENGLGGKNRSDESGNTFFSSGSMNF